MNIMQLIGKSPEQFIQNMLSNNQVMKNPMAKNTLDMAQKGNMQGIEQMARNLCKENGLDADEVMNQIKSRFGL
jgi:hypothetical protein